MSVTEMVAALPPVLRGVPELLVFLKLPEDFVKTWVEVATPGIPALPHLQVGGTRIFQTRQVLEWLEKYHGYGGEMRAVAQRPAGQRRRQSA